MGETQTCLHTERKDPDAERGYYNQVLCFPIFFNVLDTEHIFVWHMGKWTRPLVVRSDTPAPPPSALHPEA